MNSHDRQALLTTSRQPPAVVVGLDNITGLQTARILTDRGVPVVGIATNRKHFAARTNACVDIIESSLTGPALVTTLAAVSARIQRPAVLMPCTDEAVNALSEKRGSLAPGWRLPLSEHVVVQLLMDKVRFAEHARSVGLAVPKTEVLRNRCDAEAAGASITFPAVLKPPMKTRAWLAHTRAKALPVADKEELLATFDRAHPWSDVLLAQEWVPGGEDSLYSCNAYFDADGQALVTFVARKLRQWPPDVGTSASGEECRNDEILHETLRTFGSVGYHGLAYLEMKRHQGTGQMLIIEPNVGRPTGRSAIAEGGGVELVYTAYCDAAGLPLPPARQQHYADAKWVDIRRDAQAAVVAFRRGGLTFGAWARSLRGPKAHAIWSARDPLPFVVDLAHAAAQGRRRFMSNGSPP